MPRWPLPAALMVHDRFWAKVDRSGGPDACWPWTGGRNRKGYGYFFLWQNDRSVYRLAHRFAYFLVYGEDPPAVLHRCDHPPCCNPAHLFPGTSVVNNADRDQKGRTARGERKQHRLTEVQVCEIRAQVAGGARVGELSSVYGVDPSTLRQAANRKTWKHVP